MAEQSRTEEILRATIDGDEYTKTPQSREEELLLELKQTIEGGGVVPNPEGQATETLTKLGVNDTVYGIPSGGGAWEKVVFQTNYAGTELLDTHKTIVDAMGGFDAHQFPNNPNITILCNFFNNYEIDTVSLDFASVHISGNRHDLFFTKIAHCHYTNKWVLYVLYFDDSSPNSKSLTTSMIPLNLT